LGDKRDIDSLTDSFDTRSSSDLSIEEILPV
jgi:hypothetical protein